MFITFKDLESILSWSVLLRLLLVVDGFFALPVLLGVGPSMPPRGGGHPDKQNAHLLDGDHRALRLLPAPHRPMDWNRALFRPVLGLVQGGGG